MKVKELPNSIIQSLRLQAIDPNKLGYGANESETEVIISLTSISHRLPRLNLVIRSLLNQNVTFKKVVLWLNVDLRDAVPKSLDKLQSPRFEIKFTERDSAHCKLIETLRCSKNDHIVTCDDDLMYPIDWLKRLLETHKEYPESIIAHECRVFSFSPEGLLEPYHFWNSERLGSGSKLTLPLGYGGVLYPPGSLHKDTIEEALYLDLAPKNDDLWFKAMSLMKETNVSRSHNPSPSPAPIMFTQKHSLKRANIHKGENLIQWSNIIKHYGNLFSDY